MNNQPEQVGDFPIIDLESYFGQDPSDPAVQAKCKEVARCLHDYGILLIRDPRAQQKDNSDYIDLMEKYFESRGEKHYAGQELEDAKPEYHYQVGVCPRELEIARNHSEKIRAYDDLNRPVSPLVPIPDAKWRFMWKIGERPAEASDNFPQVVPSDFPEWSDKMNNWGYKLLNAVETVAEMAAIGMGLEKTAFSQRMDGGAHLLAPTGSDLSRNSVGTVFAGFHYDIAFLTIHGKSRFPGLYVWTRDNRKMKVKVPDGCLLLQSGKTFQNITGGYVLAGFHEVIYTEETKAAYEKAVEEGRSVWRVSSTMFTHFRYDTDVSPLPELASLADPEELKLYPKRTQFDVLMEELRATNMACN